MASSHDFRGNHSEASALLRAEVQIGKPQKGYRFPAAQVLQAHGIAAHWGKLVDGIINRKGTGPCPFEETVMDITDAGEALTAIRRKMEQMS